MTDGNLTSNGQATEYDRLRKQRLEIEAAQAPRFFVVADGGGTGESRFRTMKQGFSAWTLDLDEAIHFSRRVDAERFAEEDEDAWQILEYPMRSHEPREPSSNTLTYAQREALVSSVLGARCEHFDRTCMTCAAWQMLDDFRALEPSARIAELERQIELWKETCQCKHCLGGAEPPTALQIFAEWAAGARCDDAYAPKMVRHIAALAADAIAGKVGNPFVAPETKSACTCPPGFCCEKSGAAKSEQRICRDAGETGGGQ